MPQRSIGTLNESFLDNILTIQPISKARVLLLLLQLSSFALASDFLFATGGTIASGTRLYRIADAGTGTKEDLGIIEITALGNSNFDVTGLVFDYNPDIRPNGRLYVLTGPNNKERSNLVLEITEDAFDLPVGSNNVVPAQIYGAAGESSLGLTITDDQQILTWLIGDGFEREDDMVGIVESGGPLFPGPSKFNLNTGIKTEGKRIGLDFRRDRDQNRLVHIVFFDANASPNHSYFVYNLDEGEGEFRSTQVELVQNAKCVGGSMNPNVDGEFWCIKENALEDVSRHTLLQINLDEAKQVGEQSINVLDITAIAFSYDTTQAPSSAPSSEPSSEPTSAPSSAPTSEPSSMPSSTPTSAPSSNPSAAPTESPSSIPSEVPSAKPSASPSRSPSESPTEIPTSVPSSNPTEMPTTAPSLEPTSLPSATPTEIPTSLPSSSPSDLESGMPTVSIAPSESPSSIPSEEPSAKPSQSPSESPSETPTRAPSGSPSKTPSAVPTSMPSIQPSSKPSAFPSSGPTTVAENSCNINDCSFLGFLPGARLNSNVFGTCISRCVADIFEGLYQAAGWNCGPCP